jgi:Arc/MetJ family transcription regulator
MAAGYRNGRGHLTTIVHAIRGSDASEFDATMCMEVLSMAARRTTMNIDHELVAQAQDILGSENATATVHEALRDVVRRFHLKQLADWRFAEEAWDEIKAQRRPRQEWKEWGDPVDAIVEERPAS